MFAKLFPASDRPAAERAGSIPELRTFEDREIDDLFGALTSGTDAARAACAHRVLNVLLAEDDACYRDILWRVLARAGFQVTVASDGEQLIQLAASGAHDVVLTDISMPGVDGLTAIQWLRGRAAIAGAPILAMSADHYAGREAIKAGASAFLPKPLSLDSLVDQLMGMRAAG